MAKGKQKLEITLTGSYTGCKPKQRDTLRALGLRKVGEIVVKDDTESIRGMIAVVEHLISVCETK